MNVFHKVTLAGMRQSRTRTVVTIFGVVLSAALITAALTFGLSLLDYAAAGAAQKYGDWDVAFLDVDAAFTQERASDAAVTKVTKTENIGYAMLPGGKNPDKPYLYVTAFPTETFAALPLTLLSGRMPENSDEVLMPTHVASNGGVEFALGDALSLSLGVRANGAESLGQHDPFLVTETFQPYGEAVYTIVGFYVRPAFEEYTAPGYTVITKADSAVAPMSQSAFVSLENPKKAHAYAAETAAGNTVVFNNDVLRFYGLSDDPTDNLFNALLYAVGGIVIAIIMLGSIALIYNSFSISLNARTRQIGILASVGATAKQIRDSVLFEGLCIGAIGIPIGVLAGIGGIYVVISVVAKQFGSILYSGVPLTLHVSALVIAAAAVISLATILISAYIPAKRAASMPVLESILQTNEIKVTPDAVQTPAYVQRVFGLPGTLALKNCKRNRRRYRSIVLSLVLSVVLFIATSAFVADLKQMMAQALAFTTYDVGFGTQAMDDEALLRLYGKLRSTEGVTQSACQAVRTYYCAVPSNALSTDYLAAVGETPANATVELPLEVQFLDDEAYLLFLENAGLDRAAFTGDNAPLPAVAKVMPSNAPGKIEVEDLNDLFSGDALDILLLPATDGAPNAAQAQTVPIVCLEFVPPDIPPTRETSAYNEQSDYALTLLAPWSRMASLSAAHADLRVKGMTFCSENPAMSAAKMRGMLQDANITSAYMLFNSSEVLEENRNYVFIANVFSYTFIVMISLIAVANVFNTISTNIKLRRRELAMLRSVGMSERGFNKMMRFECALYGMRALWIGLPLAIFCAYLIYRKMFTGGADGIVFTLPWGSIGISIGSVLLVIFATMLYSVRQIKRENIIDALRDDMT